jgi:hypothetical protein
LFEGEQPSGGLFEKMFSNFRQTKTVEESLEAAAKLASLLIDYSLQLAQKRSPENRRASMKSEGFNNPDLWRQFETYEGVNDNNKALLENTLHFWCKGLQYLIYYRTTSREF